jgi:hypothetical protein
MLIKQATERVVLRGMSGQFGGLRRRAAGGGVRDRPGVAPLGVADPGGGPSLLVVFDEVNRDGKCSAGIRIFRGSGGASGTSWWIDAAPTAETVMSVTQALFPVFALIRDTPVAMRAACILSVAIGGGMALMAADFLRVAPARNDCWPCRWCAP